MACLAQALGACSGDEASLAVDVQTDLAPGVEFDFVRIVIGASAMRQELGAERGDAGWRDGVRVARFSTIEPGTHEVRGALFRDGTEILARTVLARVVGPTAVTITFTRDCIGLECTEIGPDGAVASCLAGRCVDAACVGGDEMECPEPECDADSDCEATVDCVVGRCSRGQCLELVSDAECGGGQICDPALGCIEERCESNADCESAGPCASVSCSPSGQCETEDLPVGTPCEGAGMCDMAGACVECLSDSHCDDGSECTTGACSSGTCSFTALSDLTACSDGECLAGMCVSPTCTDSRLNGSETDVDCGGPSCPTCDLSLACQTSDDCSSAICGFESNVCESCPEGFVLVPGNASLGTFDFCIMQVEARAWEDVDDDGVVDAGEIDADGCDAACSGEWGTTTHTPISVTDGHPWREITQQGASTLCRALGPGFDLLSNPEAMTISRNAELVGENWSGGAPGMGRLIEGHTDGPAVILLNDPSDPYSNTGNSADDPVRGGWEQRRTLLLSNGTVIWDYVGNVQEWTDWTLGGTLDPPPVCDESGELFEISCTGWEVDDFQSSTGTYGNDQGVGRVIGGTGSAVRRGGQFSDFGQRNAGIYGINSNRNANEAFNATGFRCVYRLR